MQPVINVTLIIQEHEEVFVHLVILQIKLLLSDVKFFVETDCLIPEKLVMIKIQFLEMAVLLVSKRLAGHVQDLDLINVLLTVFVKTVS